MSLCFWERKLRFLSPNNEDNILMNTNSKSLCVTLSNTNIIPHYFCLYFLIYIELNTSKHFPINTHTSGIQTLDLTILLRCILINNNPAIIFYGSLTSISKLCDNARLSNNESLFFFKLSLLWTSNCSST